MFKCIHVFLTLSIFILIPSKIADSITFHSAIPASTHFYQAHQYTTTSNNQIIVRENTVETEPPKTFEPNGEKEFTPEKYKALIKKQSDKTETRSSERFPYHRFDVTVNRDTKPSDHITVNWQGESLPGRRVTMYAWHINKKKWIELNNKIAGQTEFELTGTIKAGDYVRHQKLSIIVQDQFDIHPASFDYSFVWMSDTQYYAQNYPVIFKSVTEWISQYKDVMNIKYVFHTGDIVNKGNKEEQWKRASSYMNTLDVAKVPYGVLPGNHDQGDDFKLYQRYFGVSRFREKEYYGGSFQNNLGHFDLISVNGKDYLFAYLGGSITTSGIEWLNKILQQYADRTAILSFHEYLDKDGRRSNIGHELFQKVVLPNQNVAAVLSGHYYSSEMLVDEIDDNFDGMVDRRVYQLIADYQKGPKGGNGFIRLLHIDEETNSIYVQTYSPYLDAYYFYDPDEFPGKDAFTMDIDVKREEKMIATRYLEVTVYKRLLDKKMAIRP